MTFADFQDEILGKLPWTVRWRHTAQAQRAAFLSLVGDFDATDLDGCVAKASARSVPWALILSIVIELVKWWLENRGERQQFAGWQQDMQRLRAI